MKVFYRKKNDSVINQQKVAIKNEKEFAQQISFFIKVQERLDEDKHVILFDNKTGAQFGEYDYIFKDSFIEYEVVNKADIKVEPPQQTSTKAEEIMPPMQAL